jgi:hypothetical protein
MVVILLMLPILLWIFAIVLVSKWKYLLHFIVGNILIGILGFYILLETKIIDVGTDTYGLGTLFAVIGFGIGHSVIGFLFGIFLKAHQNK